ncbi:MAG: hypothetical protein FWG12_07620 [Holophagaceae bacterium]|nr:hypothetical protein [Holophagaceae bacterium]
MATVLTNAGKGVITNRLSTSGALACYLGWGTGAGEASATDVSLFEEAPEGRATAVKAQATIGTTNDAIVILGTMQATGQRAVTNMGVFDAVTAGHLIAKADFPVVNLNSGDSISFTLYIQFA